MPIPRLAAASAAFAIRVFALTFVIVAAALVQPARAQTESSDNLSVTPINPLVNGEIEDGVAGIPYPIIGALGDGDDDKFQYKIRVENLIELLPPDAQAQLSIWVGPTEEQMAVLNRAIDAASLGISNFLEGEIELDFDVRPDDILIYKALLELADGRSGGFDAQLGVGSPELKFQSTITTNGQISDRVQVESTVSGRIPLAFGSSAYDMSGEGPLLYENFEVEAPSPGCTFSSSTTDGTFRILSVTFPEPFPPDAAASVGGSAMPPPFEVLLFVNPDIKEKLTIQCPTGSMPFPILIHYFAGFYSWHGGQIDGQSEANEDRGGMEMRDWQSGEGDVFGVKEYVRTGTHDDVTFTEDTRIELGWTVMPEHQVEYPTPPTCPCFSAASLGPVQWTAFVRDTLGAVAGTMLQTADGSLAAAQMLPGNELRCELSIGDAPTSSSGLSGNEFDLCVGLIEDEAADEGLSCTGSLCE